MSSPARSRKYRRFIAQLRAARLSAGITQQDVARELGKPQSYVSKCESEERRVDIVELNAFAKLYGKSLKFFLRKPRQWVGPLDGRVTRRKRPRGTDAERLGRDGRGETPSGEVAESG